MMRLLVTWNLVVTVGLTALLVSDHYGAIRKAQPQTLDLQSKPDVLRARRVEIVDQQGRLTAEIGQRSERGRNGLFLFDPDGREAVALGVNDRGYGTLYFASKTRLGKVSVGYFAGGDQEVPLSREDPTGAWGIRVQRTDEAPQIFGVQVDGRRIPTSP